MAETVAEWQGFGNAVAILEGTVGGSSSVGVTGRQTAHARTELHRRTRTARPVTGVKRSHQSTQPARRRHAVYDTARCLQCFAVLLLWTIRPRRWHACG